MQIQTKRVYELPSASDGIRVLVDRLWPRGVTKAMAAIDAWAKELAPSHELRKWFGHDEARFSEFAERYRAELALKTADVEKLLGTDHGRMITLVYAAKNSGCNHAVVLQRWLEEYLAETS